MDARRYFALTWLLLGWTLAACSGSGSSGFDENAAITEALHAQRCVTHNHLMICPADASGAVASPTPSPTGVPPIGVPTPPVAMRIDTGLDPHAPIACAQPSPDAPCQFQFVFAPEGFGADAMFLVAVRRVHPDGRWTIGPEAVRAGVLGPADFEAPVAVQPTAHADAQSDSVQLAVLAFLHPPASVPMEVAALADTGADFAFVTAEFALMPEP